MCRRSAKRTPAVPPLVAQDFPESVPWERQRRPAHGAQLILVLWPSRLTQTGWPEPWGEAPSERGREVQLVPLPRPLPSSGAVRYGAWTRQGPWRPSSAHVATWNGGVAPSSGGHCLCRRLHRVRRPSSTAEVSHKRQPKSCAWVETPVWWLWWLWCRQDVTTKCLSMTPHEMHLIMGAVSLWTRLPALYLCTGPSKVYPSSQLSRPTDLAAGLPTRKQTQRDVQNTSKTSLAHATA